MSIVKSLGMVCADRKRFDYFIKSNKDMFHHGSVYDFIVMDNKGDLKRMDNVTSEAFLHKFDNIEDVILPTFNTY